MYPPSPWHARLAILGAIASLEGAAWRKFLTIPQNQRQSEACHQWPDHPQPPISPRSKEQYRGLHLHHQAW